MSLDFFIPRNAKMVYNLETPEIKSNSTRGMYVPGRKQKYLSCRLQWTNGKSWEISSKCSLIELKCVRTNTLFCHGPDKFRTTFYCLFSFLISGEPVDPKRLQYINKNKYLYEKVYRSQYINSNKYLYEKVYCS